MLAAAIKKGEPLSSTSDPSLPPHQFIMLFTIYYYSTKPSAKTITFFTICISDLK